MKTVKTPVIASVAWQSNLYKTFSRMFAAFGMVMMFAVSGWGADQCSNTTDHTFTESGVNATFSDSYSGNQFDSGDTEFYYFNIPSAGTLNFTRVADADVVYKYDLSNCPSDGTGTIINNGGSITFSGAADFNLRIKSSANNQRYDFTFNFVSSLPSISISPTTLSTTEGNSGTTNAIYTVTLSSSSTSTVTVNYTTADGTATAGSDFTIASGSLSFAPGETTKTIGVPIVGDTNGEPSETYTLTLSSPVNATIVTATATGTITNDDPPSLSIGDMSVTEGNSGTKTMTFTVALSSSPSSAVEFDWATANGTATTANNDYTAANGHIRFNPNTSTLQQTFSVTVRGDATAELDETFYINLTNITGVSVFDSQAVGTILDDDMNYGSNNPRSFEIIHQSNIKGDIKIIGNSILCKNDGTNHCAATVDATLTNNELDTLFYKLSSDESNASIKNSTSYTFAFPTGVTKNDVVWAGLYWQAGIKGTPSTTQITNAKKVLLKAQGDSTYRQIDAETTNNRFNWMISPSSGGTFELAWYYQGIKDITSIVQTKGAGTYQVANIEATSGGAYTPGHFGGWAMVVVYKDTNTTLKNITVYDGFNAVNNSNPTSATLTGFLTPSGGTVDSKFLYFGSEGDRKNSSPYNGDKISLTQSSATGTPYYLKADGTATTTSGPYNPMNSSITSISGDTRVPNYDNVIGIDIDTYNVGTSNGGSGIITNNQTGTKITLSTADDVFNPGVFAFSTQIYAPSIDITKTPSTSSSGALSAGQQIDYTASFTNGGRETAKEITIYDDFTQNLLKRTDGNDTDPAIYLSDMLERNATKIKQSIRLSSVDSTTTWHCAQGLSGVPGCTVYDANCSVDFTGDAGTTATKAWCYVPTIAVGSTYTMKFSVNVAADPDTQGQSVLVENQMFASYKDNVTGISMPNASSNIANAGSYNYAQNIAAVGFDARETSIPLADNNRSIMTKVANKPSSLSVVSLNPSGQLAPYTGIDNNRVYLFVVDSTTCALPETERLAAIATKSRNTYVTFLQNDMNHTTPTFSETAAGKDKKIMMNFINWNQEFMDAAFNCSNSNTQAVLNGVPQCLNSDSKLAQVFPNLVTECLLSGARPACQSSSYAASGVPSAPYDNEFGCYQCLAGGAGAAVCSTDNFAIRPEKLEIVSTHYDWSNILRSGEEYNTTINAYNFNSTTNTPDYNVTDANSTYVLTTTKYMKNNEANASMAGTAAFAAGGFDMQNGISAKAGVTGEIAGLSFNDVGKININIQDQNWSAVDNDDTPMNCDANGTYVCGDVNVTFIPHHFNFSALGITNNNGNTDSFTYLANEVALMAGRINAQMQARNKAGAITSNFSASPLWENPVTVVPVVTKSTYLYPDANETNISNQSVGFSFGAKTIAWDEDNASQYLRFNFRRDINLMQNPFDVNGSNLNISMTSRYTDGVKVADINGSRLSSGTNALPYTVVSPADGNSTFVYGRIIPRDIRVFGTVPFSANAWYEVFNAPRIGTTSLASSRNESSWFINGLHDDAADGDGTVTFVNSGAVNIGGTAVGGVETYGFAAQTPPYSAKAHINTDPWLWYGVSALPYSDPSALNLECMTHPCFNINVAPAVGATGSAKSGSEENKASKSSTSEGTGWHSTTDYAPAIR
ncbi:Calx-beta domain-containing protein [Sulfuricurvum sp.]|uniref:Calx-beta domain-containing protein n=1 Tax=Sulfuricurvum sp. TaxID=2025608 RepID=UPI003C3D72D1